MKHEEYLAKFRIHSWSFYRLDTGLFTGRTFTGPGYALAANRRPGEGVLEGIHDHRRKRVDLSSMTVVEYQAPPEVDPILVQERIEALERRQLRTMREILLKLAPDEAERLKVIDDEIAALRQEGRPKAP